MVFSARADVDWVLANCVITWCHADHVPPRPRHIVMTLRQPGTGFQTPGLEASGGCTGPVPCAGSFESMPVILEFTPPSATWHRVTFTRGAFNDAGATRHSDTVTELSTSHVLAVVPLHLGLDPVKPVRHPGVDTRLVDVCAALPSAHKTWHQDYR